MALFSGIFSRDERIGAVLEHLDGHIFNETLVRCVQLAEHHVAPPLHTMEQVPVHMAPFLGASLYDRNKFVQVDINNLCGIRALLH